MGRSSRRRNPLVRAGQAVREWVGKLLSLRASPHQIASGCAVGVFVGILPTFGLGAVLIMALAALWRFNVPAAVLCTIIGNPLLAPVWIGLSGLIAQLDPSDLKTPDLSPLQIVGYYSHIGLRYLLGNLLVCIAGALLSYVLSLRICQAYRRRHPLPPLGEEKVQS